jgi:hypothetical protein
MRLEWDKPAALICFYEEILFTPLIGMSIFEFKRK